MPTVREVLSQMTEEFKSAPRFNRWQPPDGPYIDILVKVDAKFTGTGADRKPIVALEGEIADGEFQGRKHSIGFFNSKMFGKMDDAYLAMGGPHTDNPAVVLDYFSNHIGDALATEVSTRKRKDTGETMRNCDIVGIVPTSDESESEAALSDTGEATTEETPPEPETTEEEV